MSYGTLRPLGSLRVRRTIAPGERSSAWCSILRKEAKRVGHVTPSSVCTFAETYLNIHTCMND